MARLRLNTQIVFNSLVINNWLLLLFITISSIAYSRDVRIKRTYMFNTTTSTLTAGSWQRTSTWSNGIPSVSSIATVNHPLTIEGNISIEGGSYTIKAPIEDRKGGIAYSLTVSSNSSSLSTLDIDANATFEGPLTVNQSGYLIIRSGDTLRVGPTNFVNNSRVLIEEGGVLIVNGDLHNNNNSANIRVDGQIIVNGNFFGGNGSRVSGLGSISTTGTLTGSGETFAKQSVNCSNGPCFVGNDCGIANSIASSQSICQAQFPNALTGNIPTGISGFTYQWEFSTTSATYGYSPASGAIDKQNYTPVSLNVTTWFRRKVITSTCTTVSNAVKIEVNSYSAVHVSISASSTSICYGTNVIFTATASHGGTSPAYQWKLNGKNVGTNNSTYSNSSLVDGDVVSCVLTSNALCISGNSAVASNSIAVAVNHIWSGQVSSSWNNSSNWCGGIPISFNNVIINSGAPNMPTLNTLGYCKNLTIGASASLSTFDNNILVIKGNWINNGIFNPGRGTVSFTGTNSRLSGTAPSSFYNLDLYGTGTVKMLNEITVSKGSLSMRTGVSLDINGTTLTIDANVKGNSSFRGSSTSNLTIGANAFFDEFLRFESGTGHLKNFTIHQNGNLILGSEIVVHGLITLPEEGKVITTAETVLTLAATASYTNASMKSFVHGPMKKISNSIEKFIFPIGKDTLFRRIGVIPETKTVTTFTAEYFINDPNIAVNANIDASLALISSLEYWHLDKSAGANSKVILYWGSSSNVSNNSEDHADLRIGHYDGKIWENIPVNLESSSTPEFGIITSVNYLSSFSPFTIASISNNNPLPVELLNFKISKKNENALIEWWTSVEVNNFGFEIEKSLDNTTFKSIGFIASESIGNSESVLKYSFIDYSFNNIPAYYRLKQIDHNGVFKLYSVHFLNGTNQAPVIIDVYPNPVMDKVSLKFSGITGTRVDCRLADLEGNILYSKKGGELNDVSDAVSNVVKGLKHGIYFLVITQGGTNSVIRIIKQ